MDGAKLTTKFIYDYSHGCITIWDLENKSSAFIQGEDAQDLLDELNNCLDEDQEQQILSNYEHIME